MAEERQSCLPSHSDSTHQPEGSCHSSCQTAAYPSLPRVLQSKKILMSLQQPQQINNEKIKQIAPTCNLYFIMVSHLFFHFQTN
jgi:hypothetical protein